MMEYNKLVSDRDAAIAAIPLDASDKDAQIKKFNDDFSKVVANQSLALKKAVSDAMSAMIKGKKEDIVKNRDLYDAAIEAQKAWEDAQISPEQVKAQEEYDRLSEQKAAMDKKWQEAKDALAKLYPESPSIKSTRARSENQAKISITPLLKQQVLDMKRAGKRNIEIQEATGLTNGQVSPILQAAGLTEKRK